MSSSEAIITVRVTPRASKSEIVRFRDGELNIRLAAPPVDGAANLELIKFLARALKVAKSDIEIISGNASRTKRIRIAGADPSSHNAVLKAKS